MPLSVRCKVSLKTLAGYVKHALLKKQKKQESLILVNRGKAPWSAWKAFGASKAQR